MVTSFIRKIFGTKHERDMRKFWPRVEKINALEPKYKGLSDEELQHQTVVLKERLAQGETLDQILEDAFAVCREASRRVLGMRHYDVQLIGGMVLHGSAIAEMKTGEGKTLVATLAVYLNALSGKGVHLVTVNDYLAKRDAEWMGRLYGFLGLSTGIITHELSDSERKQSYNCDITYCTNNELGFDYLRDNMKFRIEDYVQRPLFFAIVDECDSILIDEARTPLIISGASDDNTDKYMLVNTIIPHLKPEIHFTMEEKNKTVALTEDGNTEVERLLNIDNLYEPQNIEILHHVYQGLKAHNLYRRDVDYMIKDDEILIVDEFTGRLMEGRRWSDGLHQAVEAKEGVTIKSENQTLASITFQNYFRMYEKLAGMTGTADTEALEFKKIYNLDVQIIPTNRPIQRKDNNDVVYKSEAGKYSSIVKEILERRSKGQPVLVGTVSIERSEQISRELKKQNIPHNVLNAKHHEREAEIIAQAGRKGAVTIATNMAGRGTDIVLGGNPEFMARAETGQNEGPEFQAALQKFRAQCEAEKEEVIAAGGLLIMGTERHESRRIDNQLRGRAGRQGDPGESRFYLSLEDDLMRKFGGDRIKSMMDRMNVPDDEPIEAGMVSRSIETAQRRVEGHNFDIRKHLLEYDDVMNNQRHAVYGLRRKILGNENLDEVVKEMLSDVTSETLDTYASPEMKREQWDVAGLKTALERQFGIQINESELNKPDADQVTETVSQKVKEKFEGQKGQMGHLFQEIEKNLLLGALDHYWKEHLQRIDRVREWVNLKAYAQKDPLLEYKKEAFVAYEEMQKTVRSDVIEKLMKLQLVFNQPTETPFDGELTAQTVGETQANGHHGTEEFMTEEEQEVIEALKPKQSQKMFFSTDGAVPENEPKMSRADRRKMQRQKGKK